MKGAGDLVSRVISRVISALNGVTLKKLTYNQLTKSPAPSSTVFCFSLESLLGGSWDLVSKVTSTLIGVISSYK